MWCYSLNVKKRKKNHFVMFKKMKFLKRIINLFNKIQTQVQVGRGLFKVIHWQEFPSK